MFLCVTKILSFVLTLSQLGLYDGTRKPYTLEEIGNKHSCAKMWYAEAAQADIFAFSFPNLKEKCKDYLGWDVKGKNTHIIVERDKGRKM